MKRTTIARKVTMMITKMTMKRMTTKIFT